MKNNKSQPKDIKRDLLTVLALNKNVAMKAGDILDGVKIIYGQTSNDQKHLRENATFFENMFQGTFSSRTFEKDDKGRVLIQFIDVSSPTSTKNSYLYKITPQGIKHLQRMKKI